MSYHSICHKEHFTWKFQLYIIFQSWEIFDAVFKNSKTEKMRFKKKFTYF